MLRRQRITLALLNQFGKLLPTTPLFKLMFLLSEETFLGRDGAFYEFLPYRYGPYSFALNRELEALVLQGYVEDQKVGRSIGYTITTIGKREVKHVDSDSIKVIAYILKKYGDLGLQPLLRDVYSRYPWYSTRSELQDLIPATATKPAMAELAVYTMGYEDRSVDGFFDRLLRTGIQTILDVRANPISRKYGFAKKSLSLISGRLGLAYEHWPQLGIPSEKRKGVETPAEFQHLFGYYDRVILPKTENDVSLLTKKIKKTPSVLICMEREAQDCHRSRLARAISASSGLKIVNL